MSLQVKDPKTGELKDIIVSQDDGIRANSSLSSLSRLPPAFKKGGSTTAGNSSQVSVALVSSNKDAFR